MKLLLKLPICKYCRDICNKIKNHKKKNPGFTLVELMIVMGILSMLATTGIMAYNGYLKKGRDSSRATVARQINTEVMSYSASNGGQPPKNATQFSQFLQSASETFGSSTTEITNGTIIKDPLAGKDVCLDADKNSTQPCAFHYTAYEDGTYAISYGIEASSNMKTDFYKTTFSVESPTSTGTPITKYGVYIGSAPYIGSPVVDNNDDSPADAPGLVTPIFITKRIDTVVSSSVVLKADGEDCNNTTECSSGFCVSQSTTGSGPYGMTIYIEDTSVSKKCRSGEVGSICWGENDCESSLSCGLSMNGSIRVCESSGGQGGWSL